jgi:tetratricopeptide (TPR) repeat protein
MALVNHRKVPDAGFALHERACALASDDLALVVEMDQLRRHLGQSPAQRFAALQGIPVVERDDLSVVYGRLCLLTGRGEEAHELLMARNFHPWEGGEGQVLRLFTDVQLARARFARLSAARAAIALALQPPVSLGEARHLLAADPDIHTESARIHEAQGDAGAARRSWQQAAEAQGDFINMAVCDYSPATWHHGSALQALGRRDEAKSLFDGLDTWALKHASTEPVVDYFATSLPDFLTFGADLHQRRDRDVVLLRGIAARGLGALDVARGHFERALAHDPACQEALTHLEELAEVCA